MRWHSAFASSRHARALPAYLPHQDHVYITTDESFRFNNKMSCKLNSTEHPHTFKFEKYPTPHSTYFFRIDRATEIATEGMMYTANLWSGACVINSSLHSNLRFLALPHCFTQNLQRADHRCIRICPPPPLHPPPLNRACPLRVRSPSIAPQLRGSAAANKYELPT